MKVYLYRENDLGFQAIVAPSRQAHVPAITVWAHDRQAYREGLAKAIEEMDIAERVPWPAL